MIRYSFSKPILFPQWIHKDAMDILKFEGNVLAKGVQSFNIRLYCVPFNAATSSQNKTSGSCYNKKKRWISHHYQCPKNQNKKEKANSLYLKAPMNFKFPFQNQLINTQRNYENVWFWISQCLVLISTGYLNASSQWWCLIWHLEVKESVPVVEHRTSLNHQLAYMATAQAGLRRQVSEQLRKYLLINQTHTENLPYATQWSRVLSHTYKKLMNKTETSLLSKGTRIVEEGD